MAADCACSNASITVEDLNFARYEIFVRDTKGKHDRVTILPRAADIELREHLMKVKDLHDRDLGQGFGRVILPHALDRKLPHAAAEWPWQWVFPATRRWATKTRTRSVVIIFTSQSSSAR